MFSNTFSRGCFFLPAVLFKLALMQVHPAYAEEQSSTVEIATTPEAIQELVLVDSAVINSNRTFTSEKRYTATEQINPSDADAFITALQGYSNLEAIHIVSHADDGILYLGGQTFDLAALKANPQILNTLSHSLAPDANILLYGCDLAKTQKGKALVNYIAEQTNAHVAASENLTGNAFNQADWQLEYQTHSITAELPFNLAALAQYEHTLPTANLSGLGAADSGGTGYRSINNPYIVFDNTFDVFDDEPYWAVDNAASATMTIKTDRVDAETLDVSAFTIYGVGATGIVIDSTSTIVFRDADGNALQTMTLSGDKTLALNVDTNIFTMFDNNTTSPVTGVGQIDFNLVIDGCCNNGNKLENITFKNYTYDNVVAPSSLSVTSAAYNASTGNLVVTGTDFEAKAGGLNDVSVSKLTLTGEGGGGSAYTLTSSDVEIDSATQFTVPLNATDQLNINGLLNKDGISADDGTLYNLAAADDFMANVTSGDTADASNGITVSNVIVPTITSATYNATTGVIAVTGTGLASFPGASNDIDVSDFTFTGQAGGTYTITSATDVEITSSTAFSFTLSGADKTAVDALLNKNGTLSVDSTTYNLAAADNWAHGAAPNANIADATGNGITASNVLDADGSLTASATVSEPISLDTTIDTLGEAIDIFDFTLTDGGGGDATAMAISQIVVNVSGTSTDAERDDVTWRLNGSDATNVTGTYNSGSNTITFSGLSISVADGASETYTVNAYFNTNTSLIEDRTFILSVDGDTDVTISSGSNMGATSAVTNGAGGTWDVVATTLAITTAPSGVVSGAAVTTQPVVAARDAFGNTDVDYTETVTAIYTGIAAGPVYSNASVSAVAGVATFTTLTATTPNDGQGIIFEFTDAAGGLSLSQANSSFLFIDVVATQLAFSTQPAGSVSGSNLTTQPVVTAQDANGATDTDFTETITLTEASAGSLTGGSVAAVAGIATFTAVNYTATADQQSFTLTANDQDGVGTDMSTVDANAVTSDVVATALAFDTQPAGSVSGIALTTQPVINAVDGDGIVDTDFTETITLTEASAGSLTGASVAAVAGVATFTALTYTATSDQEAFTLTANDQDGVGANFGTVNANAVTSDVAATTLVFTTQPAGSVSGSNLTTQPVVTARDANGVTDTGFTETITLTEASAGALTGGSVAAVAGVATFTAVNYTATADQQSFTLTADDDAGVGTDISTVAANAVTSDVVATALAFGTQPAGSVSGVALTTQPVVNAVDGDGIVDTGFTETITLTEASAGSLTGGSVAAVAGVATFTALTYTATADQQAFTLTANDQDGVGANFGTVDANAVTSDVAATSLVFTTQPAGSVSGSNLTTQPVVTARDANGITDTGFTETITLTEASAGSLSGGSVAAVAGVATFTAVNYTATADQQSFILTADDDAGVGTDINTVDANAVTSDVVATALAFGTQPAGSVSGVALTTQPVVNAVDGGGTVDTGFTETITLTEASAGSLTGGSVAAVAGVATFTALTYTATADQQTFTLTANDQDGVGANFGTVDANAVTSDVVATALAFSTQPAGSVSGGALTTQPVVNAVDGNGVTDTSFTETITLTEASAGSLTGGAVAAVAGVATFTAVNYTATADQQSFTLTANDQDGVGTNMSTVNANAVTSDVVATGLVFATQPAPTTVISGQATSFTTVPVINAVNDDDVVDTGYSTGITLAEINGAGSATLATTGDTDGSSATVTLTPTAGVATYTGMQITYTASGSSDETFNLQATSGALTAATSSQLTGATTPVVTDGNLSISGATGTGGAYKIGDTLTATWNNTAGGDNNTGITTVTVDFSAFGGGASASASESSGTWTATYTIAAGAIDSTNLNISVTANNASGPTTVADSTNATLDNIAPTVTNGNLSISGASGTSGAFKTGDTVTATWNNTAGGDNNSDTINTATVDFSAFGGGAAEAASESSGTWTATYTITAGAIDNTNINISLTATDDAGNATTAADSANATVDNIAPTLTSGNLAISGATGTGGSYKIDDVITATWDNTAGGDNNSDTIASATVDFSAFGGGAAVAASESAGTWTATYTLVAGSLDGTNLNISATATDNAGNATTTADTTNATADSTAPTLTDGNLSISGATGLAGTYKLGDTLTATWDNTASGDNNSDTIASVTIDFSALGGGASVAASDSSDTWTATYTIDGSSIQGSSLNISATATDNAGNATTTADSSNASTDNALPAGHSISFNDATINAAEATSQAFTFASAEVGASYSYSINSDGGGTAVAGSGTIATASDVISSINLTGLNDGTLTLSAVLTDTAGNAATAVTQTASLDQTAPAGHSVSFNDAIINASAATSQAFTFANAEVGADYSYTISSDGGGTNVTGSGTIATATDTISSIDLSGLSDGTLTLSVVLTDTAGNAASATTDTASLDKTAPTGHSVSFNDATINASEANSQTFTFAGAEVGATYSYTINSDGGGTAVTGSATLATSTDAISSLDFSNLNDGTLTLSVIVTDTAGNAASAVTHTATLDTAAPSVAEVTAVSTPSNDSTPNVTFSTTEAGTLAVGGNCGSANEGAISAGNSTITLSQPDNSTALGDATYSNCTATVTDAAGNTSNTLSLTSFTVDTASPNGQSVSFNDATINATEATSQAFTFANAEVGSTYSYTISSDGGGTNVTGSGTIATATDVISSIDLSGLSDGTLTLSVVLSDAASNAATAVTDTASLDQTAPSGQSVAFNDALIDATDAASTSFTFASAEVASSYSYTISSSNGGTAVTGSGTIATASDVVSNIDVSGLNDGTLTLSVVLTDVAGNAATAVTHTTTLDTRSAQTITFAQPSEQNFGTTPTLSATASSNLTVSFVSNTTGVCTVTSAGELTFVTVGSCSITATQAGNSDAWLAATAVTQSFTIAAVVPAAPTIGTVIKGDGQAVISFSPSSFTGGAAITQYTVTSSPEGLTATGTSTPIILTGLTNGVEYTFTITATNSVGTSVASATSNTITPTLNAAAPPIVLYDFENNSQDGSGNNNHGVINGAASYTASGHTGSGLEFNGASYLTMPDDLLLNNQDFTVAFWFKTTGRGGLLGYQNTTAANIAAATEFVPILSVNADGKLRTELWTSNNGLVLTSTANVNDGEWHYVVMTADTSGNKLSVYLDREFVGTGDATVQHLAMSFNQLGFNKGAGRTELQDYDYFTGQIDEFTFYQSALPTSDLVDNQAPVASSANLAVTEDTATAATLGVNDPDNDTLTYTITSNPSNGVLSGTAPNLTYTPTANFNGSDSFSFSANDSIFDSNVATVSITVSAVNDAPVATADSTTTAEDTAVVVDILANDSDVDSSLNAASVAIVSPPGQGSTSINTTTGAITYTPTANSNGSDSFTYTVNDAEGATSNTATVSISVTAVNDAPVTTADSTTTTEDNPVIVDILANDSDVDSGINAASVAIVSAPSQGNTSINTSTGAITYTPTANSNGNDSFTYTVDDVDGATSNTATVSITVNAVNDAPIAIDDSASTDEDNAVQVAVLNNDSDIDNSINAASVTVTTGPANGTTSVNTGTGTITYTPAANYNGSDTFSYTVQDAAAASSNTATVTITVNAQNDAPTAVADTASTPEDNAISIDVAANDSDIDTGDSVDAGTLAVASNASNGMATVTAGEIVYTPNINFNGTDTFTYTVNDQNGASSNVATVIVNVTGVNDLPNAADDSAILDEDSSTIIDVAANDSDIDGTIAANTVTIVTPPSHGTTAIDALTGAITYAAAADYFGSDSLTYIVQDDAGGSSNIATVTIAVASVNDVPVVADDTAVLIEDSALSINVLGNDSDIDGTVDASTVTVITAPTNGTASMDATTGSITYTPGANFNGSDSLTYTVQDNDGGTSAAATVTITVNAVNDMPLANNDSATTDEDVAINIDLATNDSDLDGSLDFTSLAIVSAPSQGNVTDNADGTVTYTPNANVNGSDSFTYTLADNEGGASNTATVTVTINAINDAPVLTGTASAMVDEDGSYSFTPMISDNDNGDSLTFSVENLPSWATFDPATGAINGIPTNDNVGVARDIIVSVNDGATTTALPAFSITVANTNDATEPAADSYALDEGALLQADAATGVLANDVDVDSGDTLTATLVASPTNSSNFTLNADGSFSYRHNGGETRADSFTYTVSDGTVTSSPIAVNLAVAAVNDPPRFITTAPSSVVQGSSVNYSVGVRDPDSVTELSLEQAPSWLTLENNRLVGTAPFDTLGDVEIVLSIADQSFDVEQRFTLEVIERGTPHLIITNSWQGLPALVGEQQTLTITVNQDHGPALAAGTLNITLEGDDFTSSINDSNCGENTLGYSCPIVLSAGSNQQFKLTVAPSVEGNIVVSTQVHETVTDNTIAEAITDISATDTSVSQGNVQFVLANATALGSINLDDQAGKELIAGTSLDGTVKLLDYDKDAGTATVIGEINNTGHTNAIKVADIDRDGLEDTVVVNKNGDASAVYYARGELIFEQEPDTQPLPFGRAALLRDLNNDGFDDLIIGGKGFNLYIYPSQGGVFSAAPYVFNSPFEIVHFAIHNRKTGDGPFAGRMSIATRNAVMLLRFSLGANIQKASGQGNNALKGSEAQSEQTLVTELIDSLDVEGVSTLLTADLDGDGEEELIMSTTHQNNSAEQSGVTIVSASEDTGLNKVATLGNASAKQVDLADFNGDGQVDLLVANDNDSYQFYIGGGTNEAWQLKDTIIFNPSTLVLPEDIDNDGLSDVLIYEDQTDEVNLYLSADDGAVGITADISITTSTKVLSNASYQWQYVATLHNGASQAVSNVVATITLPAGLTVASKPAACTVDGVTVTCTAASLAANSSEPFNLVLTAKQKPEGTATARVSSNALDANTSNNTATSAFTPLFVTTAVRVEGGGKSGGALSMGYFWLLGLMLLGRLSAVRRPGLKAPALLLALFPFSTSAAEKPWYLELGLGTASSHWQASDLQSTLKASAQEVKITDLDDKRGTQEFLAGYRINSNFAVELGYRDWGEISYSLTGVASNPDAVLTATQSHYPTSGKGAFAGLRGSYWHGDTLEGYVKLSAWQWTGEYSTLINGVTTDFEVDDTDVVISAGMNGYFFERYSAGVVYQTVKLEGQRNVMVGVNVGVRF